MATRIRTDEFTRQLAVRMNTDEVTAAAWVDAVVETLYDSLKAGESVTFRGFGSFYVRPERSTWVFNFNLG